MFIFKKNAYIYVLMLCILFLYIQIVAKVNSSFPWLSTKCLEVVAMELAVTTLRVIAAHLDVSWF